MGFLKWIVGLVGLPVCIIGGVALAAWQRDLFAGAAGFGLGGLAYHFLMLAMHGKGNDSKKF